MATLVRVVICVLSQFPTETGNRRTRLAEALVPGLLKTTNCLLILRLLTTLRRWLVYATTRLTTGCRH